MYPIHFSLNTACMSTEEIMYEYIQSYYTTHASRWITWNKYKMFDEMLLNSGVVTISSISYVFLLIIPLHTFLASEYKNKMLIKTPLRVLLWCDIIY